MTTISTKRARQRAKKAAAEGGSHQKALDGIARQEGHAHWGAKLGSADVPRIMRFNPLDPSWIALHQGSEDAIRAFAREVLRTSEAAAKDIVSLVADILADMWFAGQDRTASDFPSFVRGLMDDAVRSDAMRREMAQQAQSFHSGTWETELVRRLGEVRPDDFRVVSLQRSTPSEILAALQKVVSNAREMATSAAWALRFTPVAGLPDHVIVDGVMTSYGESPPSSVALWAMYHMIPASPSEVDRAVAALGHDIYRASLVNNLAGLDPDRKRQIMTEVIALVPATEHRFARHLPVLGELRKEDPSSLMLAWLEDAFRRIISGRVPFSFNPLDAFANDPKAALASDLKPALRLSTMALIAMQRTPPLPGERVWATDLEEAVVQLFDDVLSVIGQVGRIHEFAPGLKRSYPSVLRVLERCRQEPGTFDLFAAFNGMDGAMVERLRIALGDADVMDMALSALDPFTNEAMWVAAH